MFNFDKVIQLLKTVNRKEKRVEYTVLTLASVPFVFRHVYPLPSASRLLF